MNKNLKRVGYALATTGLLLPNFIGSTPVSATSIVSDFDELDAALCAGGEIKLGADILADRWFAGNCEVQWKVTKNLTIDFNGHTITSDGNHGYNLDVDGATLTLKDTGSGTGGYRQIQTADDDDHHNTAIAITNGKLNLQSGVIDGGEWVVTLWHDSELDMSGGKIHSSTGFAITGNGTTNPNKDTYGSNVKMNIAGGEIISDDDFAIYNPSENSTITIDGATITGASGAIAANRGTITIARGEFTSLGTAEIEGSVSQDGSRGYENAVIGIPKEYGPVTLNIAGGIFTAQGDAKMIADVSNLDNANAANVSITGGTFTIAPDAIQIAENYDAYSLSDEGPWVVDKVADFEFPNEPIILQVGDTYDLSEIMDEVSLAYGTFGVTARAIAEEKDGVITAKSAGKTMVTFDLHNEYGTVKGGSFEVSAYEVTSDNKDDIDDATDRSTIENFVADQLKEILTDDTLEPDPIGGTVSNGKITVNFAALKEALSEGKSIVASYEQEDWDEDGLESFLGVLEESSPEAYADYQAALGENGKFIGAFEGTIFIETEDGARIGWASELDKEISLIYEVPEEAQNAPEGYQRKFYVIGIHFNGEGYTITKKEAVRNGDTISVDNSEFSTFVVAYEDVEDTREAETNPKTFDHGITTFAVFGGITAPVIIAGAWWLAKRNS